MTDRVEDKKVSFFLRSIPLRVKNAFKVWCKKRGMTMQTAIIKYMRTCGRPHLDQK